MTTFIAAMSLSRLKDDERPPEPASKSAYAAIQLSLAIIPSGVESWLRRRSSTRGGLQIGQIG
jgi:hypothetical protein